MSANGRAPLRVAAKLALLLVSAGNSALANDTAALTALIGPGARLTQTEHFVVAYDTPEPAMRALISRLEATYQALAAFCRQYDLPFTPPTERLEILFFESVDRFHEYAKGLGFAAAGFNGFYHAGVNRSAFFNVSNHPGLEPIHQQIRELESRVAGPGRRVTGTADGEARREALRQVQFLRNKRDQFVERLNRVVIQHEVVHHLFYVAGVHVKGASNPQWFVEGMACIFETPPSARGAGIGATNQLRLADFRAACAREKSTERLRPEAVTRALESGKFVPLRRLVAESQLLQDPAGGNLSNYYAQAWSLAFFLQRTQGNKLAEYAAKLASREMGQEVSGEEELAVFESVFGPLDEHFERRWAKFILDVHFVPELE